MSIKITCTIARLVAVVLMGQTLYFKFSGHAESMYIFRMIEMEPTGRWVVGILESIATLLLIIPRTAWLGGLLSVGLMLGAIGLHLTVLGIEIMEDGGVLFGFSVVVFLCGLYIVFFGKRQFTREMLPKILGGK